MAKKPTKQATPKTPEQAMDELTELSQELGLYDVEGNPLIKDAPTTSQEATESTLETIEDESNTVVTPKPQNASEGSVGGLNATDELGALLDEITDENKHPELIPTVEIDLPLVDEKLSLKDGWGRPFPTVSVVIQSVNYTDLVSQALYLAYLGAELDTSYRIMTVLPYRVRLLLPAENYDKWISKEDQMAYSEDTTYNRVLVKAYNLYDFWKNIVKIGENGAIVQPRHVAQKIGGYMVPCLTRSPVADTPESRMGREKIKYTKDELDSFTLEQLKIVGDWYKLPSLNAKSKYVKLILESQ